MKTLRVHLFDATRRCLVEADELSAWSQALVDEILFHAAIDVAENSAPSDVSTSVTFRVGVDRKDGSIVIER